MSSTPNFARLTALFALLALPGTLLAWNDTGHSTVDLIAYRQLKPEVRTKLDEILRAHPRYQEDLLKYMPAGANEAEYVFVRAGVWPDMVRGLPAFHRGNWHYTDVPFFPQGGEEKFHPAVPIPAKPGEPYDSISAWEYNLKRLNDDKLPMPERAIALCWVLHIGADCHQPLHNVTMYNEKMPGGDKGGNEWMLNLNGKTLNLHAIWDGSLGLDRNLDAIKTNADEITKLHPRDKVPAAELATTDIRQWVQEGRFIAISKVYLDGKLNAAPRRRTGNNTDEQANAAAPAVPEGYEKTMIETSKGQAALAGYRIGDALNRLGAAAPTTRP